MTKSCSKCFLSKDICNFYKRSSYKDGYYNICKDCIKMKNNTSSYIEYKKSYYENNKDKIKSYYSNLTEIEKQSISESKRNSYQRNKNEYKNSNKVSRVKYHKNKLKNDPVYKLKISFTRRINKSIKRLGLVNSNSIPFRESIGCSFEEFKLFIESKFHHWMSWENYGKYNGELNFGWDIDHIVPLSSAETEDDVIRLNHYTNLQPLCSKINRDIKKNFELF